MSKHNSQIINKKPFIIGCVSFVVILSIIVGILLKNNYDEKHLIGYTLENEEPVDNCDLVKVEGFYLGKGSFKDATHYIFQAKKDGDVSDNMDVTSDEIKINYTTDPNNSGKVEAFSRTYVKNGIFKKEVQRYFYKVSIPKGTIKDCGELTNDSNSDDDE